MRLSAVLALVFLVACEMALPGAKPAGDAASPITGAEIAVTTLDDLPTGATAAPAESADAMPADATATAIPAAPPARPKSRPQDAASADVAEPEPLEPEVIPDEPQSPKSAEQIACERAKGRWSVAGKSGAMACVMPTRDGGQQCTRESDCDGVCLARSGTCAPFKPLFGCNEILQDDGVRVTLCID